MFITIINTRKRLVVSNIMSGTTDWGFKEKLDLLICMHFNKYKLHKLLLFYSYFVESYIRPHPWTLNNPITRPGHRSPGCAGGAVACCSRWSGAGLLAELRVPFYRATTGRSRHAVYIGIILADIFHKSPAYIVNIQSLSQQTTLHNSATGCLVSS